ncbi:HET-domain-containing protein [Plenodomus tracheiphilus IPT5]|uniref:HET-domain-containing protein n=1 Tax=Plenodomus tracheiphilus IPT5 TaxID=1408161 RepID=A0A6A7AMQ9_9PLEO|nr:HET-domain-containing protein [Plenodomus tracheiphilus IPT5]
MRLLEYDEDGELTIISFDDNELPPYAILSHTWGVDKEVTFADLVKGDGKAKLDTCCIDKTDKAELSSAIRSMFRWYQNAIKCYAYLSDVSTRKRKASGMLTEFTYMPSFRSSRWFNRGWTLQELLAPSTVEFLSQEWEKLGDKISLKTLIHKITSIPQEVLDGAPLSQFSVNERLRWNADRETKRDEDAWYSLSGIFSVEIAPAYSEGAASAFRRLMDEIHKLERCVQDIHHTDPRRTDNITFKQWQQDVHSRLLWVKGDPGKGKTMLLCGIIDELHNSMPRTALLSYFFCQATDSRINSATAVLRGLFYMLVNQQPSLVWYVRKKLDHAGKNLFEDANAWVALTEIFVNELRDPSLCTTYLTIDALDECVTDSTTLLHFISLQSSTSHRVKWIVSSRNSCCWRVKAHVENDNSSCH